MHSLRFSRFLSASAATAVAISVSVSLAVSADENRALFNGRDLTGWVPVNDVRFEVREGRLRLVRGMGWLRTEKEYGDFVLEAELRPLVERYDSGLFFRVGLEGQPWPTDGWQINLRRDLWGALIRGYRTVLRSPVEGPDVDEEEPWSKFRLEVRGRKATLDADGKRVWEYDGIDREKGYVGIQAEDRAFDFRSLTIRELEPVGDSEPEWQALFPEDGSPVGWTIRAWNDVSQSGPEGASWRVENGVLRSEGTRGSWLMSEREYGDFELEYEFRLGERGNSGLAVRAPMAGDPAFDGMELQMADFRYNPEAAPSELTGGIYRAIAPREQVYRPTEWNRYRISLRGTQLEVRLNEVAILDVDLAGEDTVIRRHDNTDAPPIRDRPRRGHLGFQELSRDDGHVEIRNARIRAFD